MGCAGGCMHAFVCTRDGAFRECLTFSQRAGFYPKAMPHISHPAHCSAERILPDRQMLLLDLFLIKHLFTKDKPSIPERHRLSPSTTDMIRQVEDLPFPHVGIKEQ